ncbi:DUF397 domain-containing protein [Streptomyces chumphonensis]|uniref:DUF397 domain-containing protein n=1 Tax=Streptomyces chumphonensis TaxID=1214925 RepID=UPI003D752790
MVRTGGQRHGGTPAPVRTARRPGRRPLPGSVVVAATPATVHVRDSKNPAGPTLAPATWTGFIAWGARTG